MGGTLQFLTELSSILFYRPETLYQSNAYKLAEARLKYVGKMGLALASISLIIGFYVMRSQYNSAFMFEVLLLASLQFFFMLLLGSIFIAYLDRLVKKHYLEKIKLSGNAMNECEQAYYLWLLSWLPFVFFATLALVARSLGWPSLAVLGFLWLWSWSIVIFLQSSRRIYGLQLREMTSMWLRAFSLLLLFPSVLAFWLSMQFYMVLL